MAKVYELLDQASFLLNDPRGQHWPRVELLGYFNAGLRDMVSHVPSQFPVTQEFTLVAGAYQVLVAPMIVLMQVHCVINPDDSLGRVIRAVPKTALDAAGPLWFSATPAATREVAYDPNVPKEFWVYPPAIADDRLQVTTADEPLMRQVFHDVPVDSRYHSALVDFVLYRALSKDADYAQQDPRATGHLEAYTRGLNGRAANK